MEASKKILFYILGIKRSRLRTTEIGIFEDFFPEAFNERTDTILKLSASRLRATPCTTSFIQL